MTTGPWSSSTSNASSAAPSGTAVGTQAGQAAAAGTAVWGGIGGTLSNQSDLQAALGAKANLSGAAFTGPISGTNATFSAVSATGASIRAYTSLPASGGNQLYLAGGYASPYSGRAVIGDGTGWKYAFSKLASGVTTDLVTLQDDGSVALTGALTGTSAAFSGNASSGGGRLVLRDNSLENWATNATSSVAINYTGYQGGSTQYRDLDIFNGKGGQIAHFDGTSLATTLYGALSGTTAAFTSSIDSTSSTTGALTTAGGLGVAKALYVGTVGYINNSPILTLANVGTNAATFQAAVANAQAPMVGTLAQMNAYSVPTGTAPYWYATDVTAPDGLQGTLYHWTGSAWTSVGNPSAVIGRITAAIISAGAIGAQALAATIGLLSIIQSVPYSAGTSTAAPTGFKLSGTAFTATCYNGDTTGGTAVTRTVYLELGSGVSLGGYYVGDLVLGRLVNAGTMIWTTPGVYTWRCPPGIYSVTVTLQGAGGSGNAITANTTTGVAGGGAGAYIKAKCSVTPGVAYTIGVGAGGASVSASTTNHSGNAGEPTTFNPDEGGINAGGGGGGTQTAFGAGGSVTWSRISSSAAQGFAAGTANQPGNVTMVSGGLVIGACGGPCGGIALGWMGGTPLWPSNYNGYAGNGANSTFGPGGYGSYPPASTSYGAGGQGVANGGTSGAGANGFAMLEW